MSNIYIGGKTSSQVEKELNKRIDAWSKDFYIELSFQNRSYIIKIDDRDIFDFNIEKQYKRLKMAKVRL